MVLFLKLLNLKSLKMGRSNFIFPLDGFLTLGRGNNDVDLPSLEIEDHGFVLTKAEELNTMISGDDESSSVVNGRLRPRKSTANTQNPSNKSTHKTESKVAQDKPKRNSTPSKASPNKQDDLTSKADYSLPAQLLCPYCDKKFTTKLSVSQHARRIHLSTSKQDNFINCLYCNHSEAVPSEIIRHMVDSHPNQYFACLDCNTRFFSTSELAEHKLNVCERQKQAYRSKLRQKVSSVSKKDQKKIDSENAQYSRENKELTHEPEFNGLVISCELKPSHTQDAVDIEDNITTNLILPSNIGNTTLDKNAVIILDDIQWNRRIPPNFSFRNADADQILSRLGVVHRSPRVGESTRREWLKMIDVTSQKFEKCFDTNFYSRVASNVQQNLARFLDGSFNFSPDPDKVIKTRKTKSSSIINTAEGFPILLPHEQYSRNRFDGYMPRAIAPKHKWKWDSTENEKNIILDASVLKRDNHVDNCIITLVSSLDIWTQLRMRSRFEGIFCKAATERIEKQNIIGRELKEILESREIPCSSSRAIEYPHTSSTPAPTAAFTDSSDFPGFLGLSPRVSPNEDPVQPAVLSGEWVRPRCYVCCACGDQTRDARALSAHMVAHHPSAQVQHYEIVGESLLNADILKHLYVPPSQMSNRTRPLRGFRDCTKCKKSITMEDLHQHMLDCAGDTPTVRRKCRSRLFGVRRRRPRIPDNIIRKKMRKDLRSRHNTKALLRTRPRVRTEVGDAETIRKMIADLPAKRHRQAADNLNTALVLRPRRKLDKQRNKLKIKRLTLKETKTRKIETKCDINDSPIFDEDDQPLKPKTKIALQKKTTPAKKRVSGRVLASKSKEIFSAEREVLTLSKQLQDTSTSGDANTSRSQQISSKKSTQRLNINTKGNDTKEGEGSGDGSDNNDNSNKKSPVKERDEDSYKSVTLDPTPLKHSITSITASINIEPQLPEKCVLLEPANDAETLKDTRSIFLENDIGPSLLDKPPLQSNPKRCSQKKRESLLNCIEKIKSQQKGETMYDLRQADMMKSNRRAIEHAQMPLMDPHPAVISRTRDESGAAKNVVPNRFMAPHLEVRDLYQTDTHNMSYPWPGIEAQRKPNELQMQASMTEPIHVPNSPEAELASHKTKALLEGQKSKIMSTRLTHNSSPNSVHKLYQQWMLNPVTYNPTMANMHQLYHAGRFAPYAPWALPPYQETEALKEHYKNQNLLGSGQYNTSNLNYDGRRDQFSLQNEAAPQAMPNKQVNPLTPQLWNEHLRSDTNINCLTAPRKFPPIVTNDLMIPTSQQSAHNRISESSGTDSSRNCDDTNAMYCPNLQQKSPEAATNLYSPATSQENRDASHYYRSQVPMDVGSNNADMHYLHDEYGSKTNRSYESTNVLEDSSSKAAEVAYTVQNQPSIPEYYMPQLEEQQPPKSRHDADDSIVENPAMRKKISDSQEKQIQQRVLKNPHVSPSTTHSATTITSLTNDVPVPKPVGMYRSDNIDNLPNQINDPYAELKLLRKIANISPQHEQVLEHPLDLSEIHAQNVHNVNASNNYIENNGTLNLTKATIQKSKKNTFNVHRHLKNQQLADIDLNQGNHSMLSTQDRIKSIDTCPNNQHAVTPYVDQNNPMDMLSSDTGSELAYYRKTNISSVTSSSSGQLSPEEDNNAICHAESVIPQSRLDLPMTAPQNSDNNFAHKLQCNNIPQHTSNIIENVQKERHDLPNFIKQNTPLRRVHSEENVSHKSLTFSKPMHNVTFELNSKLDIPSVNDDRTIATHPLVDEDPETAGKITKFSKGFLELLSSVPAYQHNTIVKVISDMIPLGTRITNAQEVPTVTQYGEATKLKTLAICDSSTNTENSLTINTAFSPTSSILPKKRHSPSTKITRPEYTNQSVSRPLQQQSPELNSMPNKEIRKKIETLKNDSKGHSKDILKILDVNDDEVLNIDNVIDLTVDDIKHTQTNYKTTSANDMSDPESVHKLQSISKNYNDKTASLRAVRIKTTLVRKSISEENPLMITKEASSQQSVCLDSKKRGTALVPDPECYYEKFGSDSTSAQSSKHPKAFKNTTETITTPQNLALTGSEITSDCEQREQFTINEKYNVVAENDNGMKNQTLQHLSETNLKETKNNKRVKKKNAKMDTINTVCEPKGSNNDAHLEPALDTRRNQFLNAPNSTVASSINEQGTVVPDISNLINSELMHLSMDTSVSSEKENMNSQANEVLQNIVTTSSCELNSNIQQQNIEKDMTSTTNVLENEDSDDDDISLAFIVKHKKHDQTTFSENEINSSDMAIDNLPTQTTTDFKSNSNSKEASQSDVHSDFQMLASTIALKNTSSEAESVTNLQNDETRNEIVNYTRNNGSCGYEYENENEVSEIFVNDKQSTFENTSLENTDTTSIFNESNETQNESSTINITEIVDADSLVPSDGETVHNLERNRKIDEQHMCNKRQKMSNKDAIKLDVQKIDCTNLNLVNVELKNQTNLTQPIKAGKKANSFNKDKIENMTEIQVISTEFKPLSNQVEAASTSPHANKSKDSERFQSNILYEPNIPAEAKETNERALRRSRRGRSMFIDNTNANATIETNESGESSLQKIPVTKKQLIFSKLLQDKKSAGKSGSNSKCVTITETKIRTAKRKGSPGKTKSKKRKTTFIPDGESPDIHTLLYTPDNNNKNITEKERTCQSSSIENNSLYSGGIERNFDSDESGNNIHTEKRKSLSFDIDDGYKAKRIKTINKDNNTNNQHDHITDSDTKVKDIGSTKALGLSQVTLNNQKTDYQVASTSGYDSKKHPEKAGIEIRTACYNRPIVGKQIDFTSIADPINYDPYDINLDMDMEETSRPITKRKSNKSGKNSKKRLSFENSAENTRHKAEIKKKPEVAVPVTSLPHVSDSDSSISDVPLQKYVEDKEKFKFGSPNSASFNRLENFNTNVSLQNAKKNNIGKSDDLVDESDLRLSNNTCSAKSTAKTLIVSGRNDKNDEINIKYNQGVDHVESIAEPSTSKLSIKQKRNRRPTSSKRSSNISNDIDQLPLDKYKDIFGCSQRRKSNLLATKKIAETYHMIESDEDYFLSDDRQRKSSHNYYTKATDGDLTSKTQDTGMNSERKISAVQSAAQPEAGPSNYFDELRLADDDTEMDLITAQKMMDSEEVRRLERDLYYGFQVAAEANAGKTSGFNHLRAEETNQHQNHVQNVSTSAKVDTEMETIITSEQRESPVMLESPERSESPDMPDSPESLKDKPLMYPEEEVNIYEDKYDIIKRRREASANAKQVQKIDKSTKSKIDKSKKKTEKKSIRKSTKKTIYQVSQVPTKAALKGFDGIRISIPTQDLNMPPNVSPPYRQTHSRSKKRRESSKKSRTYSGSSGKSDSDTNLKTVDTPDIYEFQDDERPVPKGYKVTRIVNKYRCSSSDNEENPILKINRTTKGKRNKKHNEDTKGTNNDQEVEKTKRKKGKGKGKHSNPVTKKQSETPLEEKKLVQKTSKVEQTMESRAELNDTPSENDRVPDDYNNTSRTRQDIEAFYSDSDNDDQSVLPCNSGFVPDRNDESSYESDTSSHALGNPYPYTCPAEIAFFNGETERGCVNDDCSESHPETKNVAIVRVYKPSLLKTCNKTAVEKPNLDLIFDSLLAKVDETPVSESEPPLPDSTVNTDTMSGNSELPVPDSTDNKYTPTRDNELPIPDSTDNNVTLTRTNESPVPDSSDTNDTQTLNSPPLHPHSKTTTSYYFTTHVNFPLESIQAKSSCKKDVTCVDDGFSSPDHCDTEKNTKTVLGSSSQIAPNKTNLSNTDEGSASKFDKMSNIAENLYAALLSEHIETENLVQPVVDTESSYEPMEVDVPEVPEPPNTVTDINENTPGDCLYNFVNLGTVSGSTDYIRLKYKHGEDQNAEMTKRSAPKLDDKTSKYNKESNASKVSKRDRKANKKHKSHHKRNKTSGNGDLNKRHRNSKDSTKSKRNRTARYNNERNELESEEKRRPNEKLSPSRKSDEGISTSHDNSADTYDTYALVPVADTGVAVQRARRKCTVGKQNVLAEHWSSSESEAEPNRLKGKKCLAIKIKKSGRIARKERIGRRSHDADRAGDENAVAVPKKGRRRRRGKNDEEQHGWIVGRSHKKLVTMLVCSKSRSRHDGKNKGKEKEDKKEKDKKRMV